MKVWPTSDQIRKILRHPTAGAFRPQGHADWPNDTFTYRRIRDGDITTNAPAVAKTERKSTTDAAKSAASSKGE